MSTCGAVRKDGRACTTPTLAGDDHCFAHSARIAQARADGRRRGGANSGKAARLRALTPPALVPVFGQLEQALADVLSGCLDPRQATAAAAVARAMVATLTAGELESRVRRLETGEGAP